MTNTQAASFHGQGFEVGLHPENGCANYPSYQAVQDVYTTQLGAWRAKYSSLPSPTTSRHHCIVWSDWASQPKAELASGIRLDTNYYYYPGSWVADRPGFMNGSGMPMRFTDTDGTMIDVFQANTNMTDESGQSYPFTPNTLLDSALGGQGYYGAFTANLHTDARIHLRGHRRSWRRPRREGCRSSRPASSHLDRRPQRLVVQRHRVEQRHAVLHRRHRRRCDRADGHAAHQGPGGATLTAVNRGATSVPFTTMTVKGQEYAVFPAVGGRTRRPTAGAAGQPVSAAKVATTPTGAPRRRGPPRTRHEHVRLGTSPGNLSTRVSLADRTTDHLAELEGLAPATRYYYRIESRGPGGALTTWPAASAGPASFTTAGADRRAPRISELRVVSMPDGTARVTWRTDEPATSLVRYGRVGPRPAWRKARRPAGPAPRVVVTSWPCSVPTRRGSDLAMPPGTPQEGVRRGSGRRHGAWRCSPLEDFRTGTTDGLVEIDERGLGSLTLRDRGSGSYTSRVIDSGRKATWQRLVLDADQPAGARVLVRVRPVTGRPRTRRGPTGCSPRSRHGSTSMVATCSTPCTSPRRRVRCLRSGRSASPGSAPVAIPKRVDDEPMTRLPSCR